MHSHVCEKCGNTFTHARSRVRFCKKIECRGFTNRTTAEQYSRIDGNLSLYLNRLLYKHNNVDGKSRVNITREQLIDIWKKQGGRCAISSVPMTYRATKGEKFPYNASIDRIVPGDPYTLDNIQLVCTIINSLIKDFLKDDFARLCISVAEHNRSHSKEAMGIK